VVSAMAGETDRLLGLARAASATPVAREVDMLLATGEMVSIALVAMTLQELGCPAESFTGPQGGILTDNTHTRARIKHITTARLRRALAAGVVPVVAGFQGVSEADNVTTLGRGGSDLTAVALAAALQAERCEIYTDVDGVYSADPKQDKNARRYDRLTHQEAIERKLKVMDTTAFALARENRMPIIVFSIREKGAIAAVLRGKGRSTVVGN
jgi:aspartate kinase